MRVHGHGSLGWLAVAALALTGLPALPGCGSGGGGGGGGGTTSFQVGGTVSGLAGSGLVLQNNGGDDVMISANGSFTFPTPIASGKGYSAAIRTQPSGPWQTCSVSGGSGTVGSTNITAVTVVCSTNTYQVGGTVSGLAGTGLTLKNNGADNLSVSANGSFTFSAAVASGRAYSVTVGTQPSGPAQVCSVSGGSGTIGNSNVTGVAVVCSTTTFTVGGMVTGLNGKGLVLQNNGGDDLVIDASGAFVFGSGVANGAGYAVTVARHASSPTQYCGISNGTGTVAGANITNVTVTCPVSVHATAVALGQNHVDLTWGSIGIAPLTYSVYRSTVPGSRGTLITETAGRTTTFRDSGLRPNTALYYTVEAVSAAGAAYQSAQVTATTAATPSFPASGTPPPVTGLIATRVGNTVTLSWDAYTGAAFYEVYRTVDHQFPLGSQFTMTSLAGAFTTSVSDTIAGNGLYSYSVGLYNAATTMAAWATVSIDVPAGTLPGIERPIFDFFSCVLDSSVLHVYWYGAPGAEAHHVYAAPWVGGSPPTAITPSQGGTTAALDATTPTAIYVAGPGYYGLDIPLDMLSLGDNAIAVEAVKGTYRSVGGGGNGFPRRAAAPVGVTGVTASTLNPTTVDVSWTAVTGAGSYKVYGLLSPTDAISPATLLGTTSGTSYRSTGRTPNTRYYFRVTAIAGGPGGGAESAASDYALAKTLSSAAPIPLLPIFIPSTGQADLLWIGGNAYRTTYKIYGGASLIPTSIDQNNLVAQTTIDVSTGASTWTQWVGAPAAAYAAQVLSMGVLTVYGHYWIEEVYPDGTASARAEFVPFGFM